MLPTVDQVTLQPYQTTYVNLATDLLVRQHAADDSDPGGDYWRVSIPELVARTAARPPAAVQGDHRPRTPTSPTRSPTAARRSPPAAASTAARRPTVRSRPTGLAVVRQLPATEFDAVFIGPLPRNCTPLDEVTRWRHGFEVVLTTLGRCTVDPAPLTVAGVRADDPALGTTLPGDLWLYATDGWLQWPGGASSRRPVPVAELAFRADPACAAGLHPGHRRVRPRRTSSPASTARRCR